MNEVAVKVLDMPEVKAAIQQVADDNKRMRAAIEWVVRDASFKAPEQLTADYVTERWIDRLQEAINLPIQD